MTTNLPSRSTCLQFSSLGRAHKLSRFHRKGLFTGGLYRQHMRLCWEAFTLMTRDSSEVASNCPSSCEIAGLMHIRTSPCFVLMTELSLSALYKVWFVRKVLHRLFQGLAMFRTGRICPNCPHGQNLRTVSVFRRRVCYEH